jgi:hypothetical protein
MLLPFRKKKSSDLHTYGSLANGSRNTIHDTERVDIEVDSLGRPVAVWFRCLNLPFTVWHRGPGEAIPCNPADMAILNIEYRRV